MTDSGDSESRWTELTGAYGRPYDPRPAIKRLRRDPGDDTTWKEIWSELHHQGDVGVASYSAVPLLVEACRTGPRDWNFHGLISIVESERHRLSNPPLPEWLAADYERALGDAKKLALGDLADTEDPLTLRSAMAVVALASGERRLGSLLAHAETSDIEKLLQEWLGWRESYRDSK